MLSQTSKMVLGIIEDHLNQGDVKGLTKYGQPIEEASDILYNWQLMAMEEMADCMKYQQMEINKLKSENILLKTKNWFSVYEENLKLAKENKELKFDNDILKSVGRNNQGVIKRLKNEMESNYKDEKYQKLNNDFNTAINKAKIINEKNLWLMNENKKLKEENVNMQSKFNASIRSVLNSVYGKYGTK